MKRISRREEKHSSNKKWYNSVKGIACDATKSTVVHGRRKQEKQTEIQFIYCSLRQ